MKSHSSITFVIGFISIISFAFSSCGNINAVNDSHFTADGVLLQSSVSDSAMQPELPSKIKFYVEVSGSMNGFFRANMPTDFKHDVWEILGYYNPVQVSILTNDGSTGLQMPLSQFRTRMNTGAFVSNASTRVPEMIQAIMRDCNFSAGDVAVMISDMKYDPVGQAAQNVLLRQYSTDISRIIGQCGKSVCLVGATSNYLDGKGNSICTKSPYYFLIIGQEKYVAAMRNGISSFLENNGTLIENIESGFNYGAIRHSFGIPRNCYQMDADNPTFCGFSGAYGDTCVIQLKVDISNYRWLLADENAFLDALRVKALYGSNVSVDDSSIQVNVENITGDNHELVRKAVADICLKVYDLMMDAEVLEWSLELPDTKLGQFESYVIGVTDVNDVSKSYSVEGFIKGMFYGSVVNKKLKPNYILISKKS